MKEVKDKQKQKDAVVYFTQKELAQRWRVSEATIKSIRDRGEILYFFPPGSSRVLYPVDGIVQIEQAQLNSIHKEKKNRNKLSEIIMKKPVNPAKFDKKWRI